MSFLSVEKKLNTHSGRWSITEAQQWSAWSAGPFVFVYVFSFSFTAVVRVYLSCVHVCMCVYVRDGGRESVCSPIFFLVQQVIDYSSECMYLTNPKLPSFYQCRHTPVTTIIIQRKQEPMARRLRLELLLLAKRINVLSNIAFPSFTSSFLAASSTFSLSLLAGCLCSDTMAGFFFAPGQVNIFVLFKGDILHKGQTGNIQKKKTYTISSFSHSTQIILCC